MSYINEFEISSFSMRKSQIEHGSKECLRTLFLMLSYKLRNEIKGGTIEHELKFR